MSTNLEDYYAILADPNADKWDSVECRQNDPEMWWIADEIHGQMNVDELRRVRMALTICNRCPMKLECLELGMKSEHIRWGIWGGLFAGERLTLAKQNKYGADRRLILKGTSLRRRTGVPLEGN